MNKSEIKIGNNKVVNLQYILSVDGNQVGNCNPDPITYLHGHNQIIPGVEKNLNGLSVGDTKSFDVSPDEGYGYREEEAKISMPRSEFPTELPLELGAELQMINEDEEEIPGWITEITDETVTIDFNHPLAEKGLHFDVEILAIREATSEEIDSEEIHGE